MGIGYAHWSIHQVGKDEIKAQYRISDAFGIESCTDDCVAEDDSGQSVFVSVDAKASKIFAYCASGSPRWEIEHILLDDLLPKVLSHDGAFVLHAAGLSCGTSGLVILGESGRGKSTLSAFLGQSGMAILSDDCLIVDVDSQGHHVSPTYAGMRLFPDSIDALFAQPPFTSDMASYSSKQRVHLDSGFEAETAPVRALVFLDPPATDDAVVLSPMSPGAACAALIANSFALDPSDVGRAAQRMRQASHLARDVRAYALSYPRDYSRLPEVRRVILEVMQGGADSPSSFGPIAPA